MEITAYDKTPYDTERPAALLMGFLKAVGDGFHHLVVAASTNGATLSASVPFTNDGATSTVDPDDAHEAIFVLTLAAVTGGGAVIRTTVDQGSKVMGWKLTESHAKPLSASEILHAYCKDAETGEVIPPEEGVKYVAAPSLTV
ncbi:hypothetical protein [Streptomyces sp. CB02009]|uniref:hypothetical protein n=1 Tax=Streptomyces sp. CB02009 TaxID=1703938 RepID=UPI00093D8BC7|nr:hypothetical protein [Streptomyces sp. CB02009]